MSEGETWYASQATISWRERMQQRNYQPEVEVIPLHRFRCLLPVNINGETNKQTNKQRGRKTNSITKTQAKWKGCHAALPDADNASHMDTRSAARGRHIPHINEPTNQREESALDRDRQKNRKKTNENLCWEVTRREKKKRKSDRKGFLSGKAGLNKEQNTCKKILKTRRH